MKRVVTYEEHIEKEDNLRCYSDVSSFLRKKRSLSQSLCEISDIKYDAVKTVYESGGDLMNARSLKEICNLEESVVRSTAGFQSVCQYDSSQDCCPSYSLGNYIAAIRNRSSSQDITTKDVTFVKDLLRNCSSLYLSGELLNCHNNMQQNCSCDVHKTC